MKARVIAVISSERLYIILAEAAQRSDLRETGLSILSVIRMRRAKSAKNSHSKLSGQFKWSCQNVSIDLLSIYICFINFRVKKSQIRLHLGSANTPMEVHTIYGNLSRTIN